MPKEGGEKKPVEGSTRFVYACVGIRNGGIGETLYQRTLSSGGGGQKLGRQKVKTKLAQRL